MQRLRNQNLINSPEEIGVIKKNGFYYFFQTLLFMVNKCRKVQKTRWNQIQEASIQFRVLDVYFNILKK